MSQRIGSGRSRGCRGAGVARKPVGDGADPAVDRPSLARPQPKRIKYLFAGDVEMPQEASETFAGWAAWRHSAEVTIRVFISADQAAKLAAEYHVMLMHC